MTSPLELEVKHSCAGTVSTPCLTCCLCGARWAVTTARCVAWDNCGRPIASCFLCVFIIVFIVLWFVYDPPTTQALRGVEWIQSKISE